MKLLIQDDILDGMDVYVEYTSEAPLGRIPDPADIVLLDYGLELDGETRINGLQGKEIVAYRTHTSLRGFTNTRWMEDKLCEYIMTEETA